MHRLQTVMPLQAVYSMVSIGRKQFSPTSLVSRPIKVDMLVSIGNEATGVIHNIRTDVTGRDALACYIRARCLGMEQESLRGAIVAWIRRNINFFFQILFLQTAQESYPEGPILFQQDNFPAHTAQVFKIWFAGRSEFKVIPWPPKSPDLNEIENAQAKLKVWRRELYKNEPLRNENNLRGQFSRHLGRSLSECGIFHSSIPCLAKSEEWWMLKDG